MGRGLLLLTAFGLLVGCAVQPAPTVAFCESEVRQLYDPAVDLTTWPDDHWTVADSSTVTGLRLAFDPDDPSLADFPDNYDNLIVDLNALDGFGLSSELMVLANRALPDLASVEVQLLTREVAGSDWVSHPVTTWTTEHGRRLMIRPWFPLPPAAQGVLGVKADFGDGSGCLSPSAALRARLTDEQERLHPRYVEGLRALGWGAADVGAMSVFTTQSALTVSEAVLADIDSRDITLDGPMACEDRPQWRRCSGTVTVADYRDDSGVVPHDEPVAPRRQHPLPVRLWLPPAGTPGPYPVVLCGHGLGGDKDQCRFAADLAAPLGAAAMAVDAPEHGEHPARTQDGGGLDVVTSMFGFTLTPPTFAPFALRDNFRMSAWDRLQVVRAIQAGWDVDGDGTADLDPDELQYAGASLGGILGPGLMALAPEIQAGALIVPGGGLMDLFIDSDSFGIIAQLMAPQDWDEDDMARVIPLLQTLIDAGDPLVYAAEISRRRAAGQPQAHVAMLMAWEDAIVPNSSTARLAQALRVSTVGQALLDIPGVPVVAGSVAGNLEDGSTGGLLQLDRIQRSDGADWEPADHSYVHDSVQGTEALRPFMLDVLDGVAPELVDPYAGE